MLFWWMMFDGLYQSAYLVVLKFPSDHSECVVDEVVVYVNLQHNVSSYLFEAQPRERLDES